jgi:DNA-binding NarL/FixJ family response regulator
MLVDDHEVVRGGIRALLDAADDVVVCAEAASAREAVEVAERALPDVIVMEVRLGDGSGIEATRDIHTVGRGESLLDPAVTAAVLERLRSGRLTVKNYVSSVLTKLEVARRAEAAAYLARHGEPPRA